MHAILRWSNLCASWLSGPACKKFEHSDTALRSPFRSHMARTIQYHGRRLTPVTPPIGSTTIHAAFAVTR
ncbi:hypothetical protein HYQ45_012086 [Verticillium longisporum]|uniref:Uncharacterized protein n=1 Tax=Verticillium longisporum TaxID=100787 RepID=A0A8I2ZD21_VERLO|nr:hypothetical protein HYQ45_012086 [Verticillium longisporum]